MISERPAFLENEHFRINRTAPKDDGHWWKYTTIRPTRLKIDARLDETISFRDRKGREWLRLEPTACGKVRATIAEDYSWDGATMVPDFGLYLETLVHDVFYQFRLTEHFPFSRRECDDAFLDLMKLARRRLAIIYWRGVRLFGGHFKGSDGEHSVVLSTHVLT